MDPAHFLLHVIRPTLGEIGLGGAAAERLMLGTALCESGLVYLHQLGPGGRGSGPARGVYQVEPATHDDIWRHWLVADRHAKLRFRVNGLLAAWPARTGQLVSNLAYATAIARLVYYRRPEALPPADDPAALAAYHKQWFNTPAGAANPAETVDWFHQAVEEHRQLERAS